MFILDSLMISGLRWVLNTVATAADAELNDDTVLREELMAAEMRREMGEISDEEFRELETDLLARIREIKERRDGGSGPISMGAPLEATEGSTFQVEANVTGDFHEPETASQPAADSRPSRTSRTTGTTRTPRTPRTPRTTRTTRTIRTSKIRS